MTPTPVAAIPRAVDAGINWIDTAAVYGLGHSEEIVAKALEGVSTRPYLFTKCRHALGANRAPSPNPSSTSSASAKTHSAACTFDVIDLYQIHWPVPDTELEAGWTALAELQQEGKIRFLGASNFSVPQLERARRSPPSPPSSRPTP